MRISKFVFIIVLIIFLPSCTAYKQNEDSLLKPENNNIPIEGEWILKKSYYTNSANYKIGYFNSLSNKYAFFSKDEAVILNDYCENPQYRIRVVDTEEYLLYYCKTTAKLLGIDDKKLQVITVTSDNNFFYEVIKVNDKNIIVNINGILYQYEKVLTDNKDIYIELDKKNEISYQNNSKNIKSSALLLGLSYKKDNDEIKYKTLLISYKNNSIEDVIEIDDFIFPRKTGFWSLKLYNGNIILHPIDNNKKLQNETKLDFSFISYKLNKILYIGNDYICVEIENELNKNKIYRVYPIDAADILNPVKMSDIFGIESKNMFYEEALRKNLGSNIDESNFTLLRKSGHWILKGRISGNNSFDFNLNIVPSKNLVSYDELCINWSEIKSKVPDAVDVFTSPNKDIAVVLTSKNILIYKIENRVLSLSPIKKINLSEKSEVVISEWATGGYVEKWEDVFLNSGGTKQKDLQ